MFQSFLRPAVVAGVALVGLLLPEAAVAAPASPAAASVTIEAPEGVPVTASLRGPDSVVLAKAPQGTTTTVKPTLRTGAYHVVLPDVQFGGRRYVGSSSAPELLTTPAARATLTIRYSAEPGARDLAVTDIEPTSVHLSWSGAAGSRYELRRSAGRTAPATREQGVPVAVVGTTAVESGLAAHTQYSYSLFTQSKSRWYGPLRLTLRTAATGSTTDATYVAAPSTLLPAATDITTIQTTGTGVVVTLAKPAAAPLLGAAVVLPITPALPGGYLGIVRAISADGRMLGLTPGALNDAFDYYDLSIDAFGTDPAGDQTTTAAPAMKVAPSVKGLSVVPAALTTSVAAPKLCKDLNVLGGQSVEYSPSVALSGHFKTKVDNYHFLGAEIPTGASVDLGLAAKVTGAATIETSGAVSCSVGLPKLFKTLTVNPVPMALSFEAKAEIELAGAQKISNVGFTATGGVQVAGSMTLKNGASFSGSKIASASPLQPVATKSGSIGLTVGGALALGPGVGTEKAGVIAGVKGELDPLKGAVTVSLPSGSAPCVDASLALAAGLSLTAQVWLSTWSFEKDVTLDALQGELPYPGSPWDLPKGCSTASGTPDSLLGTGVTKVDDATTGSAGQWDHVDGFAPGKKTWVLSTGRVADAVGTPAEFASTDLGQPGNADLSALAGHPTHDAASYQVTLVPTSSHLHVRYVFASEEYPEYVGSSYNDVMAVYVGGSNCASVPGTSAPVSVNTVNAQTNSQYFVDNASGAAGYGTTMDGLTVPITCSVTVQPGVPVTIRIAVADTSDGIYDSAVALVDGGIWTD